MITLKEKYREYFKLGTAVSVGTIKSHAELITTHFDSITCTNEMKFSSLCPLENSYRFEHADAIAQFARDNSLALRGHTFTWHNQTPPWVFENTNREGLLARLKNHIEVVAKRYQNDIYCWDVVNEAIADKGQDVMRKSPWTDIIGEDFMDHAFRFAREALPNTDLYYNDYNETHSPKREHIYNTIKGMLDRGVPIDGVGLQCHISIYSPDQDQIRRSFELYAKLGLKLQITEMDVSMFRHEDETRLPAPTPELLELQAKAYGAAFEVFREYKDCVDSVTLWGVADDDTWLDYFPVHNRKNWPLLFDEQHAPKEAFHRIVDF